MIDNRFSIFYASYCVGEDSIVAKRDIFKIPPTKNIKPLSTSGNFTSKLCSSGQQDATMYIADCGAVLTLGVYIFFIY